MAKLENIFHFLKSQNKIKSETFEEFQSQLQKPGKMEKIFNYLKGNDAIKSENIEAFKQSFGLSTDPNTDPKNQPFKTKAEHDNFHIKKLLDQAKIDKPGLYEKYLELLESNDQSGMDAMIMAMGGIPQFVEPKKQTIPPPNPTDWKNIHFGGTQKTGGYRYNSGPGKPASGSTTKIREGIRKSRL